MSFFGFGKKPVAPAVVPDASTVPSAVPDASTTVSAAPAAAGVILRVTNTDSSATIDIQFTLDSNNKLKAINNGKFEIATSDGTKMINDLIFNPIDIKNGKLSIEAPIVMGSTSSSPSMGPPVGPPPGYNAAKPVNISGGSKRRRAYRPRKGTRRNRITR